MWKQQGSSVVTHQFWNLSLEGKDRKTHRESNEKTSTKKGDEDKKKRYNVLQKGGKEKKVMRQWCIVIRPGSLCSIDPEVWSPSRVACDV